MSSAISRRSFLGRAGLAAGAFGFAAACGTVPRVKAVAGPTTGSRVPLDSVPHKRTWMAWPDSLAIWGPKRLPGLQADIARVARTIARYEPLIMCANPLSAAKARKMCGPSVTVITSIPVDDCWMRDSGPIFRTDGAGGRDAIGLNFNGWGGSQTHGKDQHVAQKVAEYAGVPFTIAGFVGEGGAIETDGDGTVMATESSLVNPNRNPGMSKAQVQAAVFDAFGATKMIWFPGIVGHDITDDHVDSTSRFVATTHGTVQYPPGSGTNIWNEDERTQYEILSASTDAEGRPIEATKLFGPKWRLIRQHEHFDFVDSYVNYYACNGAVIAAQFGDPKADAAAKQTLATAFPGRVVEQLNIDHIGLGGGGIHCVTQQEPQPD